MGFPLRQHLTVAQGRCHARPSLDGVVGKYREDAEAREHGDIGRSWCDPATLPHIASNDMPNGIENVARKQIASQPISQAETTVGRELSCPSEAGKAEPPSPAFGQARVRPPAEDKAQRARLNVRASQQDMITSCPLVKGYRAAGPRRRTLASNIAGSTGCRTFLFNRLSLRLTAEPTRWHRHARLRPIW